MTTHPETSTSFHPTLQPFDVDLLRSLLADFTLLTRQQICQLFPAKSVRNVNFHLHKLRKNGHLSRRLFPATHSIPQIALYYPGPKSGDVLGLDPKDPWLLARRKQALQLIDAALPHFLLVNSVHIKFLTGSSDHPDYELLTWIPRHDALWRTLDDYGFALRPDAYGEYQNEGSVIPFFLELDCGTGRGHVIHKKFFVYHDYALSGHFKHHFCAPAFRVLFVATTPHRAHQLLQHAPSDTPNLFWVTTANHFFANPLFHSHWLLPLSDTLHSLATGL
jgi:hypothetical protein